MLQEKIESTSATITVIGLGYVGLPLALLLVSAGFEVTGIDQDTEKVDSLLRGRSYDVDLGSDEVRSALDTGRFTVQPGFPAPFSSDVWIICVPTPLNVANKPDYRHVYAALDDIRGFLQRGNLVVLESTVGPDFTRDQLVPRLEATGLTLGRDFYAGYSPERRNPGMTTPGLRDVPKLTSGVTSTCRQLTDLLYRRAGMTTVSVSAPAIAEMAKLLENTYRDVNIALVNELARVCRAEGINVHEVIEAASTKGYGFAPFWPGHGVGGHCIPIDSVFYAQWARERGHPAAVAEKARAVNDSMPAHAAERIRGELATCRCMDTAGSRLMFLGVTYKPDVNDLRGSPTLEVMEHLAEEGARLSFHDPYINEVQVGRHSLERQRLCNEVLGAQDAVILSVAHRHYDPGWLAASGPLVIDLTGAMRGHRAPQLRSLF